MQDRPKYPESETIGRPILRWVGGKQWLVQRLLEWCPADVNDRRYLEPFLGAASLFIGLKHPRAILGDANAHLISTYQYIKDAPKTVATYLSKFSRENSKESYYKIRELYNRSSMSAAQAARFIYMNRVCFNGVFRVNRQGNFNVPFGNKPSPWFPNAESLMSLSKLLSAATLKNSNYQNLLRHARNGDFIFLDPPYPALTDTAYFTHYTSDRFFANDQQAVADLVKKLDRKGCLIMMTNADTPLVRELYSGFEITKVAATRHVTCKAIRHKVFELVITNYSRTGEVFQ